MRRVAAARAKPGMVVGRVVYDSRGLTVLEEGSTLTAQSVSQLLQSEIAEILVRDPRMADVPVVSLFPPYLEARASQGLHHVLTNPNVAAAGLDPLDLINLQPVINQMTQCLFTMVLGDPDLTGSASLDGYDFSHPVKTAGLALLVGRLAGLEKDDLLKLGIAALLMNIGYLRLRPGLLSREGPLTPDEQRELQQHPTVGRRLIESSGLGEDVMRAVEEHHERWDGAGYPYGRRGGEVSPFAQIISMADTYYALLSRRPHRRAFWPHEAAEFILASSGEMFDPELVQFFARKVPHYAVGLSVRLSTGEVGIISNPNHGHVARPIVRVCYEIGHPVKPYDLDLSQRACMNKIIVEVTT